MIEDILIRAGMPPIIDQWQNKNRARLISQLGLSEAESLHQGKLNAESDMTDYENIHFKYSI